MKKVLFIAAHRKDRAPNQRFRFEQYFSFLNQNGFICTLSPLIATPEEDKLFYASASRLKKVALGFKLALRRLSDVFRSRSYDIIFIAREAFFARSIFFERLLSAGKAKIIFDFDDAIWIDAVSKNNAGFSWLKGGEKTADIIRVADTVFAGNTYLASYAKSFNNSIHIIPTTIDTNLYRPDVRKINNTVIIGWSGSTSTIEHFKLAIPALTILKKRFGDKIDFRVIGDEKYSCSDLNIQGLPWKIDTELSDLKSMDIGIMPLPDDAWAKGKCGLKALQYMALEIPCVISKVGVNSEIVEHGINGFFATTDEEWVENLSLLITDADRRIEMGCAARKTVVGRYSVESEQQHYLDIFRELVGS